MNNIIIWEKWKDPLGYDDQEETDLDSDNTDIYNEDSDEYEIDNGNTAKIKKIKCQLISTPFGLIPVNENTASSEIFNFWTGHTNFAITQAISNIIEETDGVETLNVFTKYRFRIAIGKAFNDSAVMREINNNVYSYIDNDYVPNE
jgi:hypothetical protein